MSTYKTASEGIHVLKNIQGIFLLGVRFKHKHPRLWQFCVLISPSLNAGGDQIFFSTRDLGLILLRGLDVSLRPYRS